MEVLAVNAQQAEIISRGLEDLINAVKEAAELDEFLKKLDEMDVNDLFGQNRGAPVNPQPVFGRRSFASSGGARFARMSISPSQPFSPPEMPMQMDVSMHAADVAMHSSQYQKKHPPKPPSADELRKELKQLRELSEKVNRQLKQGQLEKTTLIALNEKLGHLKINYGNIAAISVAAAGIISGLKDLIELIQMFD